MKKNPMCCFISRGTIRLCLKSFTIQGLLIHSPFFCSGAVCAVRIIVCYIYIFKQSLIKMKDQRIVSFKAPSARTEMAYGTDPGPE